MNLQKEKAVSILLSKIYSTLNSSDGVVIMSEDCNKEIIEHGAGSSFSLQGHESWSRRREGG